MTAEEEIKNDTDLIIRELKREELTSVYSKNNKIKFILTPKSETRPDKSNQERILKMLADMGAISLSPFYPNALSIVSDMLYEQGIPPSGFWVIIIQPKFNEVYEKYVGIPDKPSNNKTPKNIEIFKIEILEKNYGITAYINGEYHKPLNLQKRKYWEIMYTLAEKGAVDFNKGFIDFFNTNKNNSLYKQTGYLVTKILKTEGDVIVKNIEEIKLISQKKVTQQLKIT